MKICITQKLQILKSYAKLVFNTFSFEPSKKEIFLVYREVPELLEITDRPSPPSLPSLLLCFARRPPYAAGGPRPRHVRGQVDPGERSSATWPAPWHISKRIRAPEALPSRHAAPPCSSPPARSARSPSSRPGPNRPPPDTNSLAQVLFGL